MNTSLPSFTALWQRLGAHSDAGPVHARLLGAWSEPARAYHALQHLEECLALFDKAKIVGGMQNPDVIEMALWLHDAVYNPKAADNEEQSAALACELLLPAGVDPAIVAEIERLILVTKTHAASSGDDSCWMVDIDLAILGQPKARFQEYEDQIAREYAWVPRALFQEKRGEVLKHFLQRPVLYHTLFFHCRLEAIAHENLLHALHYLRLDEGSDGQGT